MKFDGIRKRYFTGKLKIELNNNVNKLVLDNNCFIHILNGRYKLRV
jgi:hypothetical protein